MNSLVEILKQHKLKITPQRLEILRFLENNKSHPTANDIYINLKKRNPSLSKTTVYNSLEVLIKNNIITELLISRSESRFEFEMGMHHHFLCKSCNKILDIDLECPYTNGFPNTKHKIEEVHGYLKGICEDCLSKSAKENNDNKDKNRNQ